MVRRDGRFICILLCRLAAGAILFSSLGVPARSVAAPPPSPAGGGQAEASKEACLGCHGPFDKLAGMAPTFKAPSGETINPHYFVPHNSKEAKAVPECTNCHEPHLIPPTTAALADLPKPGVDWCYTACHHKNNFTPCKECHR